MLKTILLGMIMVGCASIAFAQSDDYKKFEFFAGYSHNWIQTGIADDPELGSIIRESQSFNGFNTSITGNVSRYLGLKFDFSGHFKSRTVPVSTVATVNVDSQLYNFLGGIQIKDNSSESPFKPFAHALVGAARVRNRLNFANDVCVLVFPSPCPEFADTETGFAGAFGGGFDIRAGNRVDIRVIQVDYNPTRLFDRTQHNIRVGVGIVFH
jgi:hypothetical protein